MEKLFFTADELAIRWGLSRDDVLRLGCEGKLLFGIELDFPVLMEFSVIDPTNYEFQVKDSGLINPGFIPVTSDAVRYAFAHENADLRRIPNLFPDTDCGLKVQVKSWNFMDSDGHRGIPFLVDKEEVLRFEAANQKGGAGGLESSFNLEHHSESLVKLIQASRKFWANADKGDRSTHSSNKMVSDWLQSQGLTKNLADSAASIIRPDWAPTGRPPKE